MHKIHFRVMGSLLLGELSIEFGPESLIRMSLEDLITFRAYRQLTVESPKNELRLVNLNLNSVMPWLSPRASVR